MSINYYCTRLLHIRCKLAGCVLIPPFKNARFLDTMTMIPITYGYARVSKADDDSKNLETQLRELDAHGIRRDWSSPTRPAAAPWTARAGGT